MKILIPNDARRMHAVKNLIPNDARRMHAVEIVVPNDARRVHAVEILMPNDARRMHAVEILIPNDELCRSKPKANGRDEHRMPCIGRHLNRKEVEGYIWCILALLTHGTDQCIVANALLKRKEKLSPV